MEELNTAGHYGWDKAAQRPDGKLKITENVCQMELEKAKCQGIKLFYME